MREHIADEEESLDDLILGGLKIFQPRQGYRFSLDAVLLSHFPKLEKINTAVDLGTGNAVIPILLTERNPVIKVFGIEIQESMVKRARRSIVYNHLQERIEVIQGDIKRIEEILPRGLAELVLSNPPFWKKGEGRISSNEEEAWARHEMKVELEQIVAAASYLLTDGGKFCIIQRADRLLEVLELFRKYRLTPKSLRNVHPFIDREAKLVLLEGWKNRGGKLVLAAPLIVYEAPGVYCPEIREIYSISSPQIE
ncbi:MAG: tRNA1(Val) (adenine(37)-N6)-methyltransferase [Syntrophomonas sp.]